ncbi:MAG: UDP-N-acetylmuramoyl-tripeptide--D-alanyl-D-alanine ligase [Holosporaceae bacterium]|jgi:UDP-N-acetylmuramoyl-tripeptide--D-alanyl-D-alanine ligase|nr:UDP-N-acetylmuramoyl-tripeptide--D-alanyl-D-alanine ligase [Holosporaceae bacterium]
MIVAFSQQELSKIFSQEVFRDVSDLCVNSNEAKAGDLFVALKGEKVDGHCFVAHALENDAELAIVEKDKNLDEICEDRLIKVESSGAALRQLAKYNIERSKAKYVSITGSVGKTTTRDMMRHVLEQNFEDPNLIYASRKNFNSQIGLPICAAVMPNNVKIGIFEMGMSSSGDIAKLLDIAPPSISVITSIGEAHLKFFNSHREIALAKAEIFATKIPQEVAIIPADSPYTDFLRAKAKECDIRNIFSFGSPKSDAQVVSCDYMDEDNISVAAKILNEKVQYSMRCVNDACVLNSVLAILAAHVVSQIPLQKLAEALASFRSSPHRGESIFMKNRDLVLIDDSYNASPKSMRSAIQSLSKYKRRRKILVLGDMLELGDSEIYHHENLSATVDKFGIDLLFACGPLSKFLLNNLSGNGRGRWCENSSEIAEELLKEVQDGDCILVKGSRAMKMEHVVDVLMKNMD